jgi:hypothetical protein
VVKNFFQDHQIDPNIALIVESFIYKEVIEYRDDDYTDKIKEKYMTKYGEKEGLYQSWYDNDIFNKHYFECTYKKEKKDGLFQSWYTNGQKIVEWFSGLWDKISNWASGLWEKMTPFFEDIAKWFSDIWKKVKEFLDKWYLQTLKYTTQDQVGFPKVVQDLNLVPYTLPDKRFGGNDSHVSTDIFIKHDHKK